MDPMAPENLPTPAPGTLPVLFGRIDLNEPRTIAGLGLMAFCLGVMTGARLMRGAVPPVGEGPVVYRDVPCAGCRERAIQAAREAGQPAPAPPPATSPQPAPSEPHVAAQDPEDASRAAMAERQVAPTDAAPKSFSAYEEATLPHEHVVANGDSSVPVE